MDDRRQHAEQHLRLRPGQLEMAAEHRDPAAAVQLDQRALARAEKVTLPIIGWQGRIACDLERPAVWQQEAVALLEKHWLASTVHREPARARGHGVAFDPLMRPEADRPVAARLEAADAIASRLQERDDRTADPCLDDLQQIIDDSA